MLDLATEHAERRVQFGQPIWPFQAVQFKLASMAGGLGYMLDSPVARFYCDAKVLEIGEGTNEIQHMVIARTLGC